MRNRLKILPLGLALFVAGCSDHPLGPGDSLPLFDHVTPEHAASTFDLHDVDDLDAVAQGSDVVLSWTSVDDYTNPDFFSPDGGDELTKWHFEVYRRDDDADEPAFAQVADTDACNWDADAGLLECEYTDADLPDGDYSYVVKAFAREGEPGDHTIHHSHDSNTASVTVGGDVFHVQFTSSPGQSDIEDHADGYTEDIVGLNENSGKWDLEFVILKNLTPVTECAATADFDVVTIDGLQEWTAGGPETSADTLDPNKCENAAYQFELDNEARDKGDKYPSTGTIKVKLDGVAVENVVGFTSGD